MAITTTAAITAMKPKAPSLYSMMPPAAVDAGSVMVFISITIAGSDRWPATRARRGAKVRRGRTGALDLVRSFHAARHTLTGALKEVLLGVLDVLQRH
ncbi:hypothetical protein D3C84_978140 [compost metagenome]